MDWSANWQIQTNLFRADKLRILRMFRAFRAPPQVGTVHNTHGYRLIFFCTGRAKSSNIDAQIDQLNLRIVAQEP
jgi:hypothetical protein